MMQQAANASVSADQHGGAPDKGKTSKSPCEQGVLCQVAVASVAPPAEALTSMDLTVSDAPRVSLEVSALRSHPPDPGLRPPIHI